MTNNNSNLNYYKSHSKFTYPGKFAHLFENLPTSIKELVKIVQGIVIDKDLIELYGEIISDEQKNDTESRYVETILKIINDRNNSPISVERPPKERFVGSCRDYAIMLCSMLRHINIPARLRCGFDNYFNIKEDLFDDHWVCEYWNEEKNSWILVDANVDEVVQQKFNIAVDALDIPRNRFIVGGKAWQMCRAEKVDPDKFGVSSIDIKGLWFVRGGVVRDLASLNKFESLPWEYWGISDKDPEDIPEEDLKLLDDVAQLISGEIDFGKVKSAYNNKSLKVSGEIKSYTPFGGLKIIKIND